MTGLGQARKLVQTMTRLREAPGVRTTAMITATDTPLGRTVGKPSRRPSTCWADAVLAMCGIWPSPSRGDAAARRDQRRPRQSPRPRPGPWTSSTTGSGPNEATSARRPPDLVRRDFTADAPGEKMVGDITPTFRRGRAGFTYQLRGIRARKALSAGGRPHLRGFPRNTDSVDCDEGAFHRMATVIDCHHEPSPPSAPSRPAPPGGGNTKSASAWRAPSPRPPTSPASAAPATSACPRPAWNTTP
jgi:hypothetical protein